MRVAPQQWGEPSLERLGAAEGRVMGTACLGSREDREVGGVEFWRLGRHRARFSTLTTHSDHLRA